MKCAACSAHDEDAELASKGEPPRTAADGLMALLATLVDEHTVGEYLRDLCPQHKSCVMDVARTMARMPRR